MHGAVGTNVSDRPVRMSGLGCVRRIFAGVRRAPGAARPHVTKAHIQHRYEGFRAAHPDDTTSPRLDEIHQTRPGLNEVGARPGVT